MNKNVEKCFDRFNSCPIDGTSVEISTGAEPIGNNNNEIMPHR